jgi:hypothetical protein
MTFRLVISTLIAFSLRAQKPLHRVSNLFRARLQGNCDRWRRRPRATNMTTFDRPLDCPGHEHLSPFQGSTWNEVPWSGHEPSDRHPEMPGDSFHFFDNRPRNSEGLPC